MKNTFHVFPFKNKKRKIIAFFLIKKFLSPLGGGICTSKLFQQIFMAQYSSVVLFNKMLNDH